IHDWCISRQLWWGHRIPAWYCTNRDCKEVVVAREAPAACKCGGTKLEQDTDVLDTWFSSGLLPFTTLGWPEATRDEEVFYPNSLMITGFDILFFWVARMIMLGCWFMMPPHKPGKNSKAGLGSDEDALRASVPFREVYIHALVRDADRQKMSKTKGNVLDPIEVIGQYGTDATRFTLAAMAAPGTDIAFSESRTAGYRNFANKIWNAARFMFMNVERAEPSLRPTMRGLEASPYLRIDGFAGQTLEDRWIFSHFNRAAKDVNESLQAYRFDEAANRIYDFFWGDFCDWYIELIKPRLNPEIGDSEVFAKTLANLTTLFEASLRLLHPVMPFITEEIWNAMYDGNPPMKSIALAAYPEADEMQLDIPAEIQMAILQDLIAAVRTLRAELKVEPKIKVTIEIFSHDPETWNVIQGNREAVEHLAGVQSITEVTESQARQAPSRSTSRFDVHVVYEKKIDIAAERERLTKDLEKIEKEQTNGQRQLSNEQFLSKAPAKVVEGLKTRAEELKVLQEKMLAKLKELA
ncbi:MAG: class I tRNA ligase family protein, partial [Terriglobales bacterium]